MTALYKIVQDDHPPLPDGTSPALRDFLLQCFKKQAQVCMRAQKLCVHLSVHSWVLRRPKTYFIHEVLCTECHRRTRAVDESGYTEQFGFHAPRARV